MNLEEIKNKIINGREITYDEATELVGAPLEELCAAADELRQYFQGDNFDMCAILSVKGGSNATITGNMLTVKGVSIKEDLKTIEALGYKLG